MEDSFHEPHHGRHLLEAASPRVLGVGLGVFFLGVFLAVSILVCLFGSRTRKPGLAYLASTLVLGVVVTVVLVTPRAAHDTAKQQPQGGYNTTIIPLLVMTLLVGSGALASAAGIFMYHVNTPVYARPINYHTDVLLQR